MKLLLKQIKNKKKEIKGELKAPFIIFYQKMTFKSKPSL